ncbi:hypothetical protein LJC08_00675 [Methanimicrococcus sp. OttesenSCG-928-J09]|nr:hypothetical protein [Methanimicrococcus sp. OttesenSCG-928-J09]
MTQEDAQRMLDSTPATDPEIWEILSEQENTAAIYGEIPQKMQGADSYEWFVTVNRIVRRVSESGELDEFDYIIGIGASNYMTIEILEGEENDLTAEDFDRMKEIVYRYAEAENVMNLPLIIQTNSIPFGYDAQNENTEEAQNSNGFSRFISFLKKIEIIQPAHSIHFLGRTI